jgi:FkbM family methyltransferase
MSRPPLEDQPRGTAQAAYERETGGITDRLRALWRRSGARRLAPLDRTARAVYYELQRLRYAIALTSDLRSYRTYRRLDGRGRPLRSPTVRLRVRPLGGHEVELRPGTSDAQMLRETFRDRVHVPPAPIETRGVRTIVDLGANAGMTVAANALRYRDATIVAVELDPENAELARRNTARWADRVTILQGAVWTEDGEVPYARQPGNEFGFSVTRANGPQVVAPAFSMATILARVPDGARVNFLKMDIEGVEAMLMSGEHADWAQRVDAIALQVHDDYTLEDCARDLAALGFEPRVDRRRIDFIGGIRDLVRPLER